MNYRHVFHAGNFADVFKHAILSLCIEYLKQKPAPFRVVDTHAGTGRYDLAGIAAGKTLEWIDGVGRLAGIDAPIVPDEIAPLLEPYLGVVRSINAAGALSAYPGSPAIARALIRSSDRLLVNELHSEDRAALETEFAGDGQTKVTGLDAWIALKAVLPPRERRGLILIDPPFEDRREFSRLALALREAHRRFATGLYLLWYPIKDGDAVAEFYRSIEDAPFAKRLRAEILIRNPVDAMRLNGCGMLILNPPWTLAGQLEILGPYLAKILGRDEGARFSLRAF